MKKIIAILITSIIIFTFGYIYAVNTTFELEFKTINNKKNEEFDLYILLPKEYIGFAIDKADLKLRYDGANTLKKNTISGITIEKENVQDEIYTENGIEYIQILLEREESEIYRFDILEDYPNLDMKYRIKNDEKDYIVHIDNFKIEEGKCEIEYNYLEDIVKQPDKNLMPSGVRILIIILIVIVVIGAISYSKGRR